MKKIVELKMNGARTATAERAEGCSAEDWNKFVEKMNRNNVYCPEPVKVSFSVGRERLCGSSSTPDAVLKTEVFFDDGTKTTVVLTESDEISFEWVHGHRETPVLDATRESKLTAVAIAIVKRLKLGSDEDEEGAGPGVMKILDDLIENSETDRLSEDDQEEGSLDPEPSDEEDEKEEDEEDPEDDEDQEGDDDPAPPANDTVAQMNKLAAQMAELAKSIATGLANR